MLIKVENDSVEVVQEHMKEQPAVCKAACRIVDELNGFMMYREMEAEHKRKHPEARSRYDIPSLQELMHLFLACSDFFSELLPLLNEEQLEEFNKWKKSFEG